MSYIGGFLGVYTILLRGGNFGSAQTGNLIYLATGWFGGSWQEMVIRIIALIIFIISMIAAYLLPKYVKRRYEANLYLGRNYRHCSGRFSAGGYEQYIGALPYFCNYGIPVGCFAGARGYSSATTFSTNNLKQMVLSIADYIQTKDAKQKEKAGFYGITLMSFQIGVLGGFLR